MTWQRVTEYVVSAVPEDLIPDAFAWNVTVEWRSEGLWAVKWGPYCLSIRGKWDHEPIPSSRTNAWLAAHRFIEQDALRRAHEMAPTVRVNGLLPADLVERHQAD